MSQPRLIDQLSVRSQNALKAAGLESRDKIVSYYYTYFTFSNLPNIGRKADREIIALFNLKVPADYRTAEVGFKLKRAHDTIDCINGKYLGQKELIENLSKNNESIAENNRVMYDYVQNVGKYHRYLLKVLDSHDIDHLSFEDFEELL